MAFNHGDFNILEAAAQGDLMEETAVEAAQTALNCWETPAVFKESQLRKGMRSSRVLKSTKQAPQKTTNRWNRGFQFFQGRRSYAQATRGGGVFRGHNKQFVRPRPYQPRGKT